MALRVEDEPGHLVSQMAEGSLPLSSATGTTGMSSRLNLASMLDLPVEHFGPHRLVIQLDDQEPEAWTLNVMPPVE